MATSTLREQSALDVYPSSPTLSGGSEKASLISFTDHSRCESTGKGNPKKYFPIQSGRSLNRGNHFNLTFRA
jgi:hypothetical protein